MKKNKLKQTVETETEQPRPVRSRAAGVPMNIKRSLIDLDPEQPRKSFSAESLKELADSIREQGLLQPLVVERIPAKYKVVPPELDHAEEWWVIEITTGQTVFRAGVEGLATNWVGGSRGLAEWFKVICGERRWRASELVPLEELRCEVHENVSEADRRAWQIIENNQREAVSAIDEALALQRMIEQRVLADPAFKKETLAAELGISRAKLYGKLVLTRLHPPVREALVQGQISPSVAGVVAQVPDPGQQEKLLKFIIEQSDWRNMSVRVVQELVDDEYVKQLDGAPFGKGRADYADALAGETPAPPLPSCKKCPHRTGNMVESFPELASRPNVCTKPECFGQKCKLHWQEVAQDEAQKGATVLTESEFRKVKRDYYAATEMVNGNRYGQIEDLMGKKAPEPVLVATATGIERFYPKEAAEEALKKNGVKVQRETTPADREKEEQKRKERDLLEKQRQKLVLELAPELAKAIGKVSDKDAWAALAQQVQEGDALKKAVMKLVKTDRAKVLAMEILPNYHRLMEWNKTEWEEGVFEFFKGFGIDLEAEEKKRAPQTPELPAAEGDLLGETTRKMTPGERAKIVKATKKRWAKLKG